MTKADGSRSRWVSVAIATLGVLAAPLGESNLARGDISGRVRVKDSGFPGTAVAGARVHLQADASVVAVTGSDGRFHLVVHPAGSVVVTAAVPYDHSAAVNYTTSGTVSSDGATNAVIDLEPIPLEEDASYAPIAAATPGGCGDCHSGHLELWSSSNHARAATDAWVLDLYSGTGTPGGAAGYVFRATHDASETGFCATCHAPVAEAHAPGTIFLDEVSDKSALEGVNCSACHSIDSVNQDVEAIHLLGNATNRFPLSGIAGSGTHEFVWGPLDDVNYAFMKPAYAPLFEQSLLCASCHEYSNPTTGAPGQQTYAEWLASPYAAPGEGFRSCQDCHMPAEETAAEICDPPLGFQGIPVSRPGSQRRRHSFVGATEETLRAAIKLTAQADAAAGRLTVSARVTNEKAGHNFPSGVSIRNALLVVSATRAGEALAQTDGPTVPFWADDEVSGVQEGDYAGSPGKGFAKILQGRIDGAGDVLSPVLFIDAESVQSNTEIVAGTADDSQIEFALPLEARPGDQVRVQARLLYRRAFRALYVTKGWTSTPQGGAVETVVGNIELDLVLDDAALVPTPTASTTPSPTPPATPTGTETTTMTASTSTPTPTPLSSPTTTPIGTASSGDANCDTRVSAADLAALVRAIANGGQPPCGADVDASGAADAGDVAGLVAAVFSTAQDTALRSSRPPT